MWLEANWAGAQRLLFPFYWNVGIVALCPGRTCVSNSTSMTYRPLKRPLSVPSSSRKVHNLLPWNKKRCVLITQQWCDTSGCPPSDQISMTSKLNSLGEKHTFCPCSCEQFCQKIHRRLPNSTTPSIWANRRKSDRFQNKSDSKTALQKVASALSQPPPLPKKILHPTQEQSVPPWVVWGGTSVLCVSCKCVCAWARGNSGNPK